jgi:hypothetical protein
MLGTSITITVNAVAKVLARVDDSQPYQATYYLSETTRDYTCIVKHTVPKVKGASRESHLLRLDVTDYDANGAAIRKSSVWTVLETSLGSQNDVDLGYFRAGLAGFLDATNTGKILQRIS